MNEPNTNTDPLKDLPPETRQFIEQNLHKMDKYISNPALASLVKNLTGLDLNDLQKFNKISDNPEDGLFKVTQTKNTKIIEQNDPINSDNEKEIVFQQSKSDQSPKQETDINQFRSKVPIEYNSKPNNIEGIIGKREILIILAIAGVIAWLYYQYYWL